MANRIKEFPKQIMEWWTKFMPKQKTVIIGAASGMIVTLAILSTVLTQPQYVLLITCESAKEAAAVEELLEEEKLTYQVSDDGLQITILKQEMSDANLLLGANHIPVAS